MIKVQVPNSCFEWFALSRISVEDVIMGRNKDMDIDFNIVMSVVIPTRLRGVLHELPKWEITDHKGLDAYFLFETEAEAIEFKLLYL